MKQGHRRIVKPSGWKGSAKARARHGVKYPCRIVNADGEVKTSK